MGRDHGLESSRSEGLALVKEITGRVNVHPVTVRDPFVSRADEAVLVPLGYWE